MTYTHEYHEAEQALEDAVAELEACQFDYTPEYEWIENEASVVFYNLRQSGGTLGEIWTTVKLVQDEIAAQKAAAAAAELEGA
jgi:hypothetical protein